MIDAFECGRQLEELARVAPDHPLVASWNLVRNLPPLPAPFAFAIERGNPEHERILSNLLRKPAAI